MKIGLIAIMVKEKSRANLAAAFFEASGRDPDKTLLVARRDGVWTPMSFAEVEREVRCLAGVLLSLEVKPGDRVFLSSENRPEWAIADLAIMAIGGVAVPAFTTNTEDDFHFVMSHSGASCGITSGGALAERVARAGARSKTLKNLITMDDNSEARQSKSLKILNWSEQMNNALPPADLNQRVNRIKADDVCCFIYTSGTGGQPKGVMLTHRSIQANIFGAMELLTEGGVDDDQRFLSLLPLCHSYEHMAGMHLPIQIRSEIWYCGGAEQIATDLQDVSPTLMTAVPRLYEVLHDRITRGVKAKGGLSEKLFEAAVRIGIKRVQGHRLSLGEALLNPILDRLVRAKVKARLGGRLKYFISGGAALNPEIGYFFLGLGVNILQGYGQTEASPLISANRPKNIRISTVGPAVQGAEVKLTSESEIIVKGDLLMKGYWQDQEATKQAIVKGWLHTGDLGTIDEDGYITITGRKKDIIVNSGGDNIAPNRVEAILTMRPEIEQVMVDGDRRPWLVAVIVPSADVLESAGDNQSVIEVVSRAVDASNRHLSKIEQIRRFILADEPFGVDNAQMTATLKVRRHIVRKIYGQRLDALYPKK